MQFRCPRLPFEIAESTSKGAGASFKSLGVPAPGEAPAPHLKEGRAAQAIEAPGTIISSIVTLINHAGFAEAVIRVATINPGPALRALEAWGYSVRDSWRG